MRKLQNRKALSREELKNISGSGIIISCSNECCPSDGRPRCPRLICPDVVCPQDQ